MATCRVGNYTFQWGPLHLSKQDLEPLRHQHDHLASAVINKLQDIQSASKSEDAAAAAAAPAGRTDLYALLRDHRAEHPALAIFWDQVHSVPAWVDWDQIRRGQRFFYRYAPANLMGFALQGFMGENSAAAGVVEVLVRTGGFSTRTLLRRLLETFQFVLQVTDSPASVRPGGPGHVTAVRVRLLHASVRERILRLAGQRDDYFDVGRFGVPVNTLDSIHSISVFCYNHAWLQLPAMGIHPSPQEAADYVALFRYVGYLLGTPDEYFSSAARAKATMESMLAHEITITPISDIVANNFVQCLTDIPPLNVSERFIEAGSRVLNGDDFCDKLGLGRPGWASYASFWGFCHLSRGLIAAQNLSTRLDDAIAEFMRRNLHHAVIQSKYGLSGGSKLEFKHVPQLGKKVVKQAHGRPSLSVSSSSWLRVTRPLESFLLAVYLSRWLVIGLLLWGIGGLIWRRLVFPGHAICDTEWFVEIRRRCLDFVSS